jgi:NAD(P)-dependent dehydrogenase (short-subunit alcohol dehydrogenase family)
VFNTNIVGIQIASAAFLSVLKKASTPEKRAKILNISSTAGSISRLNGSGFPHSNASYPASKAALNSFTKFFATADYAKNDLIVLAICPGWVRTDVIFIY